MESQQYPPMRGVGSALHNVPLTKAGVADGGRRDRRLKIGEACGEVVLKLFGQTALPPQVLNFFRREALLVNLQCDVFLAAMALRP